MSDVGAGAVAGGSGASVRDEVERLLAGPRPLPIVQAGHPVLRTGAARYTGQLDDALGDVLGLVAIDGRGAAQGSNRHGLPI